MVVFVTPPPVPVIVMVCEPVLARELTVMLMVELPEPVAMGVGLKLTVTPEGTPEADKLTGA